MKAVQSGQCNGFMQVLSGISQAEQVRVAAARLIWFVRTSFPGGWAARSDDGGLEQHAPRRLVLICLRKVVDTT